MLHKGLSTGKRDQRGPITLEGIWDSLERYRSLTKPNTLHHKKYEYPIDISLQHTLHAWSGWRTFFRPFGRWWRRRRCAAPASTCGERSASNACCPCPPWRMQKLAKIHHHGPNAKGLHYLALQIPASVWKRRNLRINFLFKLPKNSFQLKQFIPTLRKHIIFDSAFSFFPYFVTFP